MRTPILVIITDNVIDEKFKNVWIDNVKMYNDKFTLWFVYGKENRTIENYIRIETVFGDSKVVNNDTHNELYINIPDTFENIIFKTLVSMSYVLNVTNCNYLIRTNMSTLLNLDKFEKIFNNLPKKNLFAGPFIGNINKRPWISGTLFIMSRDTVEYILSKPFVNDKNEDIIINTLVPDEFVSFNIPRLDFIQDTVLYHKSFIGNEDILCFRFKTSDRLYDATLMNDLMISLGQHKETLTHFVSNLGLCIREEMPVYQHVYNTPCIYKSY